MQTKQSSFLSTYFNHARFSERRLLLQLGDLVCLNVALGLLVTTQFSAGDLAVTPERYLCWAIAHSVLWLIVATIGDIYDLLRAANVYRSILSACSAAFVTAFVYFLLPFISPDIPIRRAYLFLFPLWSMAIVGAWRFVYATVLQQPVFSRNVLIVGAGKAGQALMTILVPDAPDFSASVQLGYNVHGFIDDDLQKSTLSIHNVPVTGTSRDLVQQATEWKVDEVIVAITNVTNINADLHRALLDCHEQGIQVSMMSALYMELTGRVPTEHVDRNLHVILPHQQPASHRLYLFVRRFIEILISALGCVLLTALIPFIWLANRLSAPGDLFFRQARVGAGGSIFHVVKFRSMVMDAEQQSGAVWARADDPRVTFIGRLLRKTRLDELPQFWNVLRGDMSLVGPRPERPYFVKQLSEQIPYYRIRHAVKPGITGWAQVKYPYGSSIHDARMKLQYDLYYIKHQSPYLDLLILLKTIQVVLGLKGR